MICLNRGLPLEIALTPSHISTNIGLLTNLSSVVTRNTMGSPPLGKCTRTASTCLLQNFAIVDRDKQMSEARTFSIIVIGVALLIGSIHCICVCVCVRTFLYVNCIYLRISNNRDTFVLLQTCWYHNAVPSLLCGVSTIHMCTMYIDF